jgi:hypothetical protein
MSIEATNRDKLIQVRCTWSTVAAVRSAADRKMTTVSEYLRGAILARLRSDGLDPSEFAPPSQLQHER